MTAESLCESRHGDVLLCCIVTFLPQRVAYIGFQRDCEIARRTVLRVANCAGLRWPRCLSRGRLSFREWCLRENPLEPPEWGRQDSLLLRSPGFPYAIADGAHADRRP